MSRPRETARRRLSSRLIQHPRAETLPSIGVPLECRNPHIGASYRARDRETTKPAWMSFFFWRKLGIADGAQFRATLPRISSSTAVMLSQPSSICRRKHFQFLLHQGDRVGTRWGCQANPRMRAPVPHPKGACGSMCCAGDTRLYPLPMVSRSRPTTRPRGALPTSLTPAFSRSPAEMATSRIWPRRVSSRPASGPTTILTNFGPAMATNHSRSCRTSDSHRICHNRRSQRNRDSYRTHRRHQGHRIRHSRRSNRENISGDTACDSNHHAAQPQWNQLGSQIAALRKVHPP